MPSRVKPIALVPVASAMHEPTLSAKVLSGYRRWLRGAYDVEAPLPNTPEWGGVGGV